MINPSNYVFLLHLNCPVSMEHGEAYEGRVCAKRLCFFNSASFIECWRITKFAIEFEWKSVMYVNSYHDELSNGSVLL